MKKRRIISSLAALLFYAGISGCRQVSVGDLPFHAKEWLRWCVSHSEVLSMVCAAAMSVVLLVLYLANWRLRWGIKRHACARADLKKALDRLEKKSFLRNAELAQSNCQLRKSEEKYREFIQNANSIILRMDVKGNVTFFNEYAQRFFGYKEEEILGQNVIGTIVPVADSIGHDLAAMINGIVSSPDKYSNNENENILRDGRRVWIAWTNKAIIDKDKGVQEILCIGNDITALKAAEDQMLKAKEAAENANKAKSSFLTNMSHELRTPLNAIIGFSELMKDETVGPINERQKEYLGYVWDSGRHLLSLINDILDISKVEAGKMELELSEFDLKELLKKSVVFISEKALKHNITLSTGIEEGLGVVRADERKVKQVIYNMLSNAAKFTPDGGKIGLEAKKINEKEIRVCSWDTGIGIDAKDAHKVFAEFEQIDSEYSRKYAGTGLGMPLSKKFVELHGGKMWFESEGKDKGSRFYFTLPIRNV